MKNLSTAKQIVILIWLAVGIVGLIVLFSAMKPAMFSTSQLDQDIQSIDNNTRVQAKEKRYPRAKEITTPDGFINTPSITIQDEVAKGNVVLLDIWTYSCINCQRTLPYLKAWHEKYKNQGLTIIGLHTPEFEFEKDINNVQEAVDRFGITYPVVLDNDFSTWRAYQNQYWPRKYLIDADGFMVYDHIGEGGYEETEQKIQELLEERNTILQEQTEVATGIIDPQEKEQVNHKNLKSPEIYFGAWRNDTLANGIPRQEGPQQLSAPDQIQQNALYLTGDWDITREYATNESSQAKITFQYQADKVFMVLSADETVTAQILIDGKPIDPAVAGKDVVNGILTVQNEQLYRIIENSPPGEHTLEIIIEEPGLEAFTFTFG